MLEQLLLKKSKKPILKETIVTGISVLCLLFLACLVEKQPYLWNSYLKYKIFVDVPLALLLPVFVYIAGRKNTKNKKQGKNTETADKIRKKEPILYLFTILFALGFSFSLTGCPAPDGYRRKKLCFVPVCGQIIGRRKRICVSGGKSRLK